MGQVLRFVVRLAPHGLARRRLNVDNLDSAATADVAGCTLVALDGLGYLVFRLHGNRGVGDVLRPLELLLLRF